MDRKPSVAMDSKPLWDAIDLDDEEQVIRLLKSSHGDQISCTTLELSLPGWSGFTLLHWAAQRGYVHAVSLLLASGADADTTDESGDTVLHHAARCHRTAVVELLLQAAPPRLDLNARNKDGDSPLHLAAANGAARIVKMLACASSCRLNDQNRDGDTPLHLAARFGNILALKLILTFECIDSTLRNRDGDTPLHLAVARGKKESVHGLLICKRGPLLVNSRNKAHFTPLLLACSIDSAHRMMRRCRIGRAATKHMETTEIVELLLQEGADVKARDVDGNNALHLAACSGSVDVITALLSFTQGASSETPAENDEGSLSALPQDPSAPPLDQNLSVRSRKKAEILTWVTHNIEKEQLDEISPSPNRKEYFYSTVWGLDAGPFPGDDRVNLPNKEGETALHLAARHGHYAAAKALLDLHADITKLNNYFASPLDYAFKAKHDTTVALLISRGAELSDYIKHALVEQAVAEVGKSELVPKPRHWDLPDLYLLHTTAMAGRVKILEALLAKGEERDVNVRNEWKQTPLHCAAILGKMAIVMSLARRQELRANAEDNRGKTALQYAVECKHSKVEKVLLERVDVKESIDRLYRDRQVYIDAANAVLVGAALIGGVTYAGWLQPPLGYVDQGFADMKSLGVRVFWAFNSMSFCFAMSTVLAGAGAILPRPDVYITTVVRELRRVLALAALLMVMSILCVLAAFAAAGFAAVQKPGQHLGPVLMAAAVTPGMSIAVGLMFWFIAKMWALLPRRCVACLPLPILRRKLSSSVPIPISLPHDHSLHCSSPSSSLSSLSGIYN